jgi:O-antigen ligase
MNRARGLSFQAVLMSRVAQLTVGVVLSATAAWLLGRGHDRILIAAGAGLVIGGALLRWPSLSVVALLTVCQELDPAQGFGGASGSGLLFLCHQLYFTYVGRISLLTIAVVLGAFSVAATRGGGHARRLAPIVVVALAGYCALRVWSAGGSVTSAINQDGRFGILFLAGFLVAAGTARSRDWRRYATALLVATVSAMALLGLYLYATGQGEALTGTRLIFYDAALGAVAGAALLAVISTPAPQRSRWLWMLGAGALAIVVLSSRRDVWAAIVIALLFGLVFSYDRMRLVLRLAFGAAVAVALLSVFFSGVLGAIGHQFSAIWGATQGTSADASTHGHLHDISIGWQAVRASPVSGLGPNGHLAGLVIQSPGPLYIHNQVLESWLRFGLLAAVLVIAAQMILVVQALRIIRQPAVEFMDRWAAYFLLMAPVSLLTAPFLTNTQRWPTLLGFAAGLVAVARAWTPQQRSPDALRQSSPEH